MILYIYLCFLIGSTLVKYSWLCLGQVFEAVVDNVTTLAEDVDVVDVGVHANVTEECSNLCSRSCSHITYKGSYF